MAKAPKSNSATRAIDNALAHVRDHPSIAVPAHLRDRANRSEGPEGEVYRSPHAFSPEDATTDYLGEALDFYEQGPNDLPAEEPRH